MARVHSWRCRIPDIISALESTPVTQLGRSEVEALFGVQRRAALRLMEAVEPTIQGNEWLIDRGRLLRWLGELALTVNEVDTRSEKLRRGIREAASQKLQLRAELRRLGKPEPTCWTVPPEAFTAEVRALPPDIVLAPGRVTVTFPPDDPTLGAKLLYELSLALVSDWHGFCSRTGHEDALHADKRIENLLRLLEAARLEGVEEASVCL